MKSSIYHYKLLESVYLTNSILKLQLGPISKILNYLPGQYIKLYFENNYSCFFSIVNIPNDQGIIELHIRINSKNLALLRPLIEKNDKITNLVLEGPYGKNSYPTSNDPLLLIAEGLGIIPLKIFLDKAIANNDSKEIKLIWFIKDEDRKYYFITNLHKYLNFLTTFAYQTEFYTSNSVFPPNLGNILTKYLVHKNRIYISGSSVLLTKVTDFLKSSKFKYKGLHSDVLDLKKGIS